MLKNVQSGLKNFTSCLIAYITIDFNPSPDKGGGKGLSHPSHVFRE